MQDRENQTGKPRALRLAYWESVIALRSGGVRITLVVYGLLLCVAVVLGVLRTQARQNNATTAAQENDLAKKIFHDALEGTLESPAATDEPSTRRALLSKQLRMSANSPYLVSHATNLWNVSRRPSPLSALSVGASNQWPDLYRIRGLSLSETVKRSDEVRPVASVYGPFDATFVLMAIAPLVVIGLTFNSSSSDRESAFQSLVVAQTPGLGKLIALRCFVRATLVTVVALGVVNGGLLIAFASQFDLNVIFNLAVWNVLTTLYLLFWAALSLIVNSFAKSSSANGAALLLLWLLLVLVIPASVSGAVESTVPTSAEREFAELEKNTIDRATENIEEVVQRFRAENPDVELRADDQQQMILAEYLLAYDEAGRQSAANITTHYSGQLLRTRYLDYCNWISPAIAFRNQSDRCSGNSESSFISFTVKAAEAQAAVAKVFLVPGISNGQCTVQTLDALPRFQDSETARRPELLPALLSIAALTFWLLVLTVAGISRFRSQSSN